MVSGHLIVFLSHFRAAMNSHCRFNQSQHFHVATFQALRKVWRTFGVDRQRAEKIAVSTVGTANFRWIRWKRTTCRQKCSKTTMKDTDFGWDPSQFKVSKTKDMLTLLQAIGPPKSCLICTFGCLQQSCCWPESPRYLQLVNQQTSQSSSSTRKGLRFWRISAISCCVWGWSWWANLKPQHQTPGDG